MNAANASMATKQPPTSVSFYLNKQAQKDYGEMSLLQKILEPSRDKKRFH
jgi:hypothetical protein